MDNAFYKPHEESLDESVISVVKEGHGIVTLKNIIGQTLRNVYISQENVQSFLSWIRRLEPFFVLFFLCIICSIKIYTFNVTSCYLNWTKSLFLFCLFVCLLETGVLCIAQAVLELNLYTRLVLNFRHLSTCLCLRVLG